MSSIRPGGLELVVDCDPGVDDALALLALAQLQLEGLLSVSGVTAVAGNAPVEVTSRNAAYVVERSALRGTPVRAGNPRSSLPSGGRQYTGHGADGLGGLGPTAGGDEVPGGASDALAASLSEGHEVLALGPLTTVARALAGTKDGGRAGATRIVAMGGRRGNGADVPKSGEFNFAFDVGSAEAVVSCGRGVTLVPIDVTELVTFTEEDVDLLRHSASNALVADLLDWMVRRHRRTPDGGGFAVHDATALMLFVDPGLGETSQEALSVWADGPRAGALRPHDGRRDAVECVVDCDAGRIKSRLLELWAATSLPGERRARAR